MQFTCRISSSSSPHCCGSETRVDDVILLHCSLFHALLTQSAIVIPVHYVEYDSKKGQKRQTTGFGPLCHICIHMFTRSCLPLRYRNSNMEHASVYTH